MLYFLIPLLKPMTFTVISLGEQLSSSSILVTESEVLCSNHHKQVTEQLYLHVNRIAEQRCLQQPEVTIKIPHRDCITLGGILQIAPKICQKMPYFKLIHLYKVDTRILHISPAPWSWARILSQSVYSSLGMRWKMMDVI